MEGGKKDGQREGRKMEGGKKGGQRDGGGRGKKGGGREGRRMEGGSGALAVILSLHVVVVLSLSHIISSLSSWCLVSASRVEMSWGQGMLTVHHLGATSLQAMWHLLPWCLLAIFVCVCIHLCSFWGGHRC